MVDFLIIVPHEDDELAIAGPLIYGARQKNQKVKIVFVTKGNFYPHEAPIRQREALAVAKLLGVANEDVIFLGHGDQEIERRPELRAELLDEVTDLIVKEQPKVLVTTGWDHHIDHQLISDVVDAYLEQAKASDDMCKPIVLKGLAYNGKWEGPFDYYFGENWTENVNNAIGTEMAESRQPWSERLRFLVPDKCITPLLGQNVLYQAAKLYKSQSVDLKGIQFINRDLVYWIGAGCDASVEEVAAVLPLTYIANDEKPAIPPYGPCMKLLRKIGNRHFYVVQFGRNRLWPYKYFLMKRNPNLKETDSMWKFWGEHLKFFMSKVKER